MPRFTMDDRAVDILDVNESSFVGAGRWVVLAALFSGFNSRLLVVWDVFSAAVGSSRSSCLGGSEGLPVRFFWFIRGSCFTTFLFASLPSPPDVMCPDLLDFALACDVGVAGCVPLSAAAPECPLLVLTVG